MRVAIGVFGLMVIALLFTGCTGSQGSSENVIKQYFEEATYVGSKECARCHRDRYTEWKNTFHARMMQDVNAHPEAIQGDFESESEVRTFSREDVAYTIGGNLRAQQYYLTYIGNDLFYLPAGWYGNEWRPRNPAAWDKPENSWFLGCSGCHTVGADPEAKTFVEPGIGCESCHGPGSVHVSTSTAVEARKDSIINPKELPDHLEAQICGQCHTNGQDPSGTYSFQRGYLPGRNLEIFYNRYDTKEEPQMFYPDGTSNAHHPQYIDWSSSSHAEANVQCSDCHDPHQRDHTHQLKDERTQICLGCHELTGDTSLAHSIHDFGSCEGCHMSTLGSGPGHTFRVVTPDDLFELAEGNLTIQPTSCNNCHYHEEDKPEDLLMALETLKVAKRGELMEVTEEEASEASQ